MRRNVHFAIKLSAEEHTVFLAVAERERMPVSMVIRRLMYLLAEEHGIVTEKQGAEVVE